MLGLFDLDILHDAVFYHRRVKGVLMVSHLAVVEGKTEQTVFV